MGKKEDIRGPSFTGGLEVHSKTREGRVGEGHRSTSFNIVEV